MIVLLVFEFELDVELEAWKGKLETVAPLRLELSKSIIPADENLDT